jgi:hypothetical protein
MATSLNSATALELTDRRGRVVVAEDAVCGKLVSARIPCYQGVLQGNARTERRAQPRNPKKSDNLMETECSAQGI